MRFGLRENTIKKIQAVLADFSKLEEAIIFGSRALGNYKTGSDIDLALKGNISFQDLLELEKRIDDLLLPYQFDLARYEKLTEEKLLTHIKHFGKVFYVK
jgi:predicted nucleotidyltransferase